MSVPRIGIVGASGAVGGDALACLRADDRFALRGGHRHAPASACAQAEWLAVDVDDPPSLARFCEGCAIVLNAAGPSCRIDDRVARAADAAGADYVDAFGGEGLQRRLDARPLSAGRRTIHSAGSFPGLSGLLPRWLAAQGFDHVHTLSIWAGGRERCTPAAGADVLLSTVAGFGQAGAAWIDGRRVGGALAPQDELELPGVPGRVHAQPFLTDELARLAAGLGLRHAQWHTLAPSPRATALIGRWSSRLAAAQAADPALLAQAVAELVEAAELDLAGHAPYYRAVVELDGLRGGRLRVLVCGTTFGQVYLRGVPLYTAVEQVPPQGVDLACVVVRTGVVGGVGTELALALLARGIHVLQEHPLHHDEVAACLRATRETGCRYRINSFYPDVAPVVRFIDAARRALALREAVYVDAACSVHVLYPLVDMLGQALGALRPWSFARLPDDDHGGPFTCIVGRIGGVPLTLRVQNQLDPADPDNHTQLLHRIALGTGGGTLTLSDTHGHVLWHPRMHLERRDDGVLNLAAENAAIALPVGSLLGSAETPTFGAVFRELWPQAIARALLRMHAAIGSDSGDAALNQYTLASCKAWQELGALLGPTRPLAAEAPRPLPAEALLAGADGLPA